MHWELSQAPSLPMRLGSSGIVCKYSGGTKHQADVTARSWLPFTASSVWLPEATSGPGGRTSRGNPAALVVVLHPFEEMIPRAAPVAVIDGTDFL